MGQSLPGAAIARAFASARATDRVALIPYVMAGYPDSATSEALAIALGEAGADILEIGVPFSDPQADGATIQAASQRALDQGMTLGGALEIAGRVAERIATPLVLMTYYNPIFSYGLAHFCAAATEVGISGLIVPDLPPEEADVLLSSAAGCGLALIFLVAPTSPDARIERMAQVGSGFIYCVSLSGVTGAREHLPEHLTAYVSRVRAHTTLPLAVGFGVSRPEHVAAIGRVADGAVVASALLNHVDAAPAGERVQAGVAFLRELQRGTPRSGVGTRVPGQPRE